MKNRAILIKVSEEFRERLRKLAEEEDMNVSEYVRGLVEQKGMERGGAKHRVLNEPTGPQEGYSRTVYR